MAVLILSITVQSAPSRPRLVRQQSLVPPPAPVKLLTTTPRLWFRVANNIVVTGALNAQSDLICRCPDKPTCRLAPRAQQVSQSRPLLRLERRSSASSRSSRLRRLGCKNRPRRRCLDSRLILSGLVTKLISILEAHSQPRSWYGFGLVGPPRLARPIVIVADAPRQHGSRTGSAASAAIISRRLAPELDAYGPRGPRRRVGGAGRGRGGWRR